MGLKSIHLLLILLSIGLSGFLGFWCTQQHHQFLAIISYVASAIMLVYAIYFIKKVSVA